MNTTSQQKPNDSSTPTPNEKQGQQQQQGNKERQPTTPGKEQTPDAERDNHS
ncbi:hypothetical protein [uncultured Stenotrophomonas sp.]|uniref:hypothetical protein n=1 Tax=uncultured Stenotrophomonas sp. TaxID=165438 RepID=UPI0025EA6B20|nr:hypothetical protein [uncultured Stenotrophomonas sp.]